MIVDTRQGSVSNILGRGRAPLLCDGPGGIGWIGRLLLCLVGEGHGLPVG